MNITDFLHKLNTSPDSIEFNEVIALIDQQYDFTPTQFKNGTAVNEAGKNSGSCKLFAFAKLHGLSQSATLNCFGEYYRKDVLQNMEGADHQNIRNFMNTGWEGISFDAVPLTLKSR